MKLTTLVISLLTSLPFHAQVLSLEGDSYILINDTVDQKRIGNKTFIDYDFSKSEDYAEYDDAGNPIVSDMDQRLQFIFPEMNWIEYVILQDSNGYWGVINSKGRMLVDFKYKQSASFLNDNYYAISDGEYSGNEYYDLVDNRTTTIYSKDGTKGKTYTYNAFMYYEGTRIINNNGYIGMIDSNMNEILACEHKCTSWDKKNFFWNDNGLLALTNGQDLCGIVDTNGNILVPFVYDYIGDPHFDYNRVKYKGKYGAMDRMGKINIEPEYDFISQEFYNNQKGWVQYNGKWMVVDESLKNLSELTFDSIKSAYYLTKEMEVYIKGKGWGVLNTENFTFIIPTNFDETSFSDGKIWTKKGSIVQQFDLNGVLIDQYDETKKIPEDDEGNEIPGFIVKKNDKKGFESNGVSIIPIKYDVIIYDINASSFFVSKKEKCGWINMKGEIIVDIVYDFAYSPQSIFDEKYNKIGYKYKMVKNMDIITFNEKGEIISEKKWKKLNPPSKSY
jgi:hypothetical protein